MPVVLEHITQPTSDDWDDLEKIRADTGATPDALGFSSTRQDLEGKLNNDFWILAGRFNDRLVGAMLVTRQGNELELSQAGVRTITQRKGVLHQLLFLLDRWTTEHGLSVYVHADGMPEELQKALARRNVDVR